MTPASPMTPVTAALDIPFPEPGLDRAVRDGLARVERRLADAVRQTDPIADQTSRHLVQAGGKRVRPMLTLLASHLGDPDAAGIVEAAVVVELTHLATLYHDDVMDSAPMRRGAPAAHEVWGNTVAILTGDLLFARASAIVAGLGPEAVRIQAATFQRLVLGQMHETLGPLPGEDAVAHYLQVLSDKTGSLIATAARFGAMFGGCPDSVIDVLLAYGERVGVAFQLADDVIDLVADGSLSGKTPGTDLREGVPTLPVLLARREAAAGDVEAARIGALLDGDLSDDATLHEVIRRLRAHPVTEQAAAEARRWAREAIDVIDPLPPSPARDALQSFAQAVVDRTS
jgi:heptaprenyl diphosphate synthase